MSGRGCRLISTAVNNASRYKLPKHSCWTPAAAVLSLGIGGGRNTARKALAPKALATLSTSSSSAAALQHQHQHQEEDEFAFLRRTRRRGSPPNPSEETAAETARLDAAGALGQPTSRTHPHLLAPGESESIDWRWRWSWGVGLESNTTLAAMSLASLAVSHTRNPSLRVSRSSQ